MTALDVAVISVGFHTYKFGAGGFEKVRPAPADGGLMEDVGEHTGYGGGGGVAFEEGGEDISACGAGAGGQNCGGEGKEGKVEGVGKKEGAVVAVGD